jgi:hypothetical protein
MNAKNEAVFAKAVAAKIEKSKALGSKATWSTEDHLKALAECVTEDGGVDTLAVLQDAYNISGYQQVLARTFAKTGHFQRDARGVKETSESLIEKLAKEIGG